MVLIRYEIGHGVGRGSKLVSFLFLCEEFCIRVLVIGEKSK